MSLPVFVGIAVVFFIIGVVCIIKGTSSEEGDAVPISNPKEIEEFKSSFMSPEKQDPPNPQTDELPKGGSLNLLKAKGDAMSGGSNQQSEINELTQKNEQLERNLQELNEEKRNIKDSQVEKINALEEKITNVLKEKEKLLLNRQLIDDLKAKGEIFEKQFTENRTRPLNWRLTIF